jgi:MATE family multidrug resistance protein
MHPYRESWRLAWPLILSNLSVPMLGMVDTAVVGHLPSPQHLGAVSLGATLISVLYFVFGFLRMGTTALTAQAFGAAEPLELRTTLARGLVVAAGLGLLVLAAGPIVTTLSARLFAPAPEILAGFRHYVAIRLFGAPAALATFVLFGWLLGLQDSRRPLLLMLVANGVNAALDVLFVFGLGMAAAGVALATVIAEYAGLALGLVLIRREWRRRGGWPGWGPILIADRFRRLLVVNRDLFLRSLMLESAFLAFTALGSRQGALILAANAVLMNFFTLAAYGLDGFAHAAEAMVGRAIGARDRPGFLAAVRAGFANAAVLATAMTLLFWLLGPWLVRLMTDLPEVRAAALAFLPWVALLPAVSVWAFLFDGVFFGATRTAELRNGMAAALALFALLAWLLLPPFGNHGLWLAFLIFLAGRAVLLGVIWWRAERGVAFVPA